MEQRAWSISAEWIVRGDAPAVRRGVLRGRGGRIETVGPRGEVEPAAEHRSLGRAVVLPGLINAHTHLELTPLRGKLPARRPLAQWLFGVARKRPRGPEARAAGIRDGAVEALAAGTTTLADTCHDNFAWRVLKPSPLRKVCFAEVMGIGPLAPGAKAKLEAQLADLEPDRRLRFGIAPHAPYSVTPELYRDALAIARRRGWPVSTHLAETESERQFLRSGGGKLFEFLARLGLYDSSVEIAGAKPVVLAERLGLLEAGTLLGHCNYIDDEELELLAGSSASVAYCPRSAAFFGHTGHRYPEMLSAGVNVCLGTDSLASNTTLSILDEMRRLRRDARTSNAAILAMGTVNGARALGMDAEVGTLNAGKLADLAVVPLGDDAGAEPVEAVLTGEQTVAATMIGGEWVQGSEGQRRRCS